MTDRVVAIHFSKAMGLMVRFITHFVGALCGFVLLSGCGTEKKAAQITVKDVATKTAAVDAENVKTAEPVVPASDPVPASKNSEDNASLSAPKPTQLPADLLSDPQLIPLNKQGTILADTPRKRLLLKSHVCLTNGQLEMLLCLKQTKEHESILTLDGQAFMVHATLLAWGFEKGKPGKYDPDKGTFETATGPKIDVFLHWVDASGKLQRQPAQSWVRRSIQRYFGDKMEKLPEDLKLPEDFNLRYDPVNQYMHWYGPMSAEQRDELLAMSKDAAYQKLINRIYDDSQPRQMDADWVFVGSFETEEGEPGQRYQAEGGYVICLANFPMAMIDVATQSSAMGGENLVYEAWTERLPPRGSEVLVELVPHAAAPADQPTPEVSKEPATK